MTLLAPLGLLALLALPLILLLHMLRERRRRVVVPSLVLWQRVPRRDEAQRRRRLPLSLLLLLHVLAAGLLGFALTQPYLALPSFTPASHTAVVIDVSTSMAAATPGGGTRLDAARTAARRVLAELGPEATVTLVAAGSTAHVLDSGGSDDAARLSAALDQLQPGGTGTDLAGALTLAEAALQGRQAAQIMVLTDASLPAPQLAALEARSSLLPITWTSVGAPQDNRAIVALATRPRSQSGPVQVYARVVNYGAAPLRTTLRLYGDDRLLDTRPLTLASQGESELTWTVPRDLATLRAELDGGDSLPADDVASVIIAPVRPIQALVVSLNPDPLMRALRSIPGVSLQTVVPSLYVGSPESAQADLTIFERYVPEQLPGGGVLLINPPADTPWLTLGDLSREPADGAAQLRVGPAGISLLDGLSLASVSFGPVVDVTIPEWATPALLRGEQPLIVRGRIEQSEVAVWMFDLSQGNLTSRLAFPLLVARSVRDLTPPALPASALLGEAPQLVADPRATELELGAPDGQVSVLPLRSGEPVRLALNAPGVYALLERGVDRTLFTGQLAVNAGAPAESDLTPRPLPAAGGTQLPPDQAETNGQPLWPWLAGLALVVIIAEWLYVHWRRAPSPMGSL